MDRDTPKTYRAVYKHSLCDSENRRGPTTTRGGDREYALTSIGLNARWNSCLYPSSAKSASSAVAVAIAVWFLVEVDAFMLKGARGESDDRQIEHQREDWVGCSLRRTVEEGNVGGR